MQKLGSCPLHTLCKKQGSSLSLLDTHYRRKSHASLISIGFQRDDNSTSQPHKLPLIEETKADSVMVN